MSFYYLKDLLKKKGGLAMKNNKDVFLTKLRSIERRAKSIIFDAQIARQAYETCETEIAYQYAMKLEDTAERLTLTARELPVYTWKDGAKEDVENQYSELLNIKIGFTQTGLLAVIMQFLLPKKEKGSAEYIRQNLYAALSKYFKDKPYFKMRDVFIVYRHVYDERYPERKMRDHDNIEINMVNDCISTFVLEDDSPGICNHCYMSAVGCGERTEVYVIPKAKIQEWFDFEKTIPKGGGKLYENTMF